MGDTQTASDSSTQRPSLAARCKRALRHLWSGQAVGRRAFPDATLGAIEAAIGAGEARHRAEVRLIVEAALDWSDLVDGISNRQRALALFAQYGIWDTEENCGVLIYVNLAERQIDIVADRNIARRVDAAAWQAICQRMSAGFAGGAYHDSTLAALAELNDLLCLHFPADGARQNQLPNQPIIF